MRRISWLHLTDFHLGLKGQKWLYPNVREAFFEDLERYADERGLWDLVLFTGDLTQKGAKDEFSKFNKVLEEVWDKFKELGCNPLLVTVPGNHDLVRPKAESSIVEALKSWGNKPSMRDGFWNKENDEYRKAVKKAFANYEKWQEDIKVRSVQKDEDCEYEKGLLPGDFSACITMNGMRVGIIGINTAFLQLTGDDYVKKLDVDIKQLHEACGMDFPNWVKKNDVNLLLTHHPPSWFSDRTLGDFQSEILGKNNFLFHIYGHMHEGDTQFISRGGGEIKREIQGTSLFGLETWGDGSQQRIHGYNSVEINIGDEGGEAIIWPRILRKPKSGHYYMRPDDEHYQLEKDCVSTTFPIKKGKVDVEKLIISRPSFIERKESKEIVPIGTVTHKFHYHETGRMPLNFTVDFIKTAKSQITVLGCSLRAFMAHFDSQPDSQFKEHVIDLLKRGVNFDFILMDPESKIVKDFAKDRKDPNLIGHTQNSIASLKSLVEELKSFSLTGKVEVYVYKRIPFSYVLLVDSKEVTGRVLFNHYLPATKKAHCPCIELYKSENPIAFDRYCYAVGEMLRSSRLLFSTTS